MRAILFGGDAGQGDVVPDADGALSERDSEKSGGTESETSESEQQLHRRKPMELATAAARVSKSNVPTRLWMSSFDLIGPHLMEKAVSA